jgi:hypothetical protein
MHGHGPTPVEGAHQPVPRDEHERRWLILGVLSLSLLITALESFVTGMQAGLWVASGVGLLGAVVAGAFLPRRSIYVHPEPETAATVADDVSAPAPVPSPATLHGGLTR